MKRQFDWKNNNTQISDDDTTTQIQIGFNKWWIIIPIFICSIIIWWP